ncbi:MAG TPA: NAD-dependent epimerase/dehydratase family protein [Bacteroidota bacterium]|nr:NAD-dependent epimerase/dehydratase family protein [Bacteroidota bacterium]
MKYFVTGGTGFIGRCVLRQLRDAGHEVIALVRSPEKANMIAGQGVQTVVGDVTDKESMRAAMSGVDGVFHLAAWYRIGAYERWRAEAVNVGGTRNVLELVRELNVPKAVYTSTLAVNSHTRGVIVDESYRYFGSHLSIYDETKWRAHYQVALPLMQQGLSLVIVQPGLVYGPGDESLVAQTLRLYLLGRLPVAPRETAFCFAHVEDVARGHLLAMEKGRVGETYFICGPPLTFTEALSICERITGKKAPKFLVPPLAMKAASVAAGLLGRVIRLPEPYTAEALRVNAGTTYLGSDAKARRELGFSTRPIDEGLRETLSYEMKKLGMPVPYRESDTPLGH